jgi:outer membrane murein-binding lipoprotein Lpp|tara:strand:+ start:1154 stop:1549 length:396 start_codon:yes stop_codon:yes gene_type:complete
MKNTDPLQQRFLLCIALTFVFGFVYQFYISHGTAKQIESALSERSKAANKLSDTYLTEWKNLNHENAELKGEVFQLRTAFYSSQAQASLAQEQIDNINNYWRNELNKINDELFDLKNKKLSVNKKGKSEKE